ncbi:putative helicase [Vibrio phage vB_VaS_L1]|nr:putative helicase [Vibrio phage vB_VaS_L1]
MAFKLRPYQQEAVNKVVEHVKICLDPCVLEAATGSGKSLIIAEIAKFFNEVSGKKTLVIGPNKEICQQNAEKYKSYGFPASFWSASIGKKEMRHQVVFGSPVSIKNELDKFGPQFGAVIIDEAHLLSPTVKEICSHMKDQNNLLRVVGLTATPYRLGSGYIYEYDENNNPVGDECTKNPFFKRLVYRITAKELIDQGFLTPPIADHEVASKYDTSGVQLNKRNQFDAKDIEQAFEGQGRLTAQIIADVVSHCQNKMCCMIFAATIQHAQEIMESLPKHNSYCVTGKTKRKDREKAIERAKTGEIKYLVSVGTLTTGVDITNVDVIAILRATESASLLQQIIGRALRLHENKECALVLDYAENIERHGLEDDLFNPDIRVSGGGEGSAKVNALCKSCGTVNEFTLRKGCDLDHIDEYGYALDLAGERIEMEGQPMPAHYGRRCYGGDVINGHYVRCSERWSMKVCPECEAENDIAARYCTSCRAEIVDPNEKLKADYKRMKRDPRAISTDKLLGWDCKPWITQRGNNTLRVDYRSEYRSFTIWYSPDSSNVKAQGLWNNLSEVVFGKGHIAPTPEAFCDALKRGFGTMPETITVQKQGDFFRAFAHGLPEDDKPE